jgi:Terminase large subunit, ATPase domain
VGIVTPTLAEDFTAFCDAFRIPLFDWQRQDFGRALQREHGRFVYRIAGISVPRGDGKSYATAASGLWRMVCGKAAHHISTSALDREGAKVMLGHARKIIRDHPDLSNAIKVMSDGFVVPSTGSRWTITTREHESSRGEHPDLILYDEVGWAKDDELFASLLASQASVTDPLALVVSTVGRRKTGPLWTIKQLAEAGDPHTFWAWCGHNRSPKVTQKFLDQQRRLLMPVQFAREHQNLWVDAADGFCTTAQVDAAMGRGWTEQETPARGQRYEAFVDIGTINDPSVIALGHLDRDRVIYIDRLITFQGSREQPVQLRAVEEAIAELCRTFPMARVRVESWQGVSAVQNLQRRGLPVKLFAPTAKAHAEEWPVLAQRLATGTIALPPHARLREELLNLVVEMGPTGVKVVDRGKVHQDHAVAVRGVVAQLHPRAGTQVLSTISVYDVERWRAQARAMQQAAELSAHMWKIQQRGRQ